MNIKILIIIMSLSTFLLSAQSIVNYTTADGLLSDFVECIAVDINDNVWLGTSVGVQMFDGTSWTSYTTSIFPSMPSDNIKVISTMSNGDVWIGTDFGASRFDGVDWITYTTSTMQSIPLISNQIKSIDEDPNTVDIVVTTDEDTPIDITLSAEEYDGDSYSFSVVSSTTNGSLSLNGSVVTYTPNLNWYGTDSFTFQALDDRNIMNIATATITVNPVNDAPNIEPITVEIDEDNGGNGTWSGIYNFGDVEGDVITYSIDSSTAHPEILASFRFFLSHTWWLDIDPSEDYFGTHEYTYTASDGMDTSTSTITLTVNNIYDAPRVENISLEADKGTASTLEVDLSSHVTSSDVPLSDLTYSITGWNLTSTITDSLLTIQIPSDFGGTDNTNWYVDDGTGESNYALIDITVDCPGEKPSLTDITLTIPKNTSTQIDFADYVTNPSDIDLTYVILGWTLPYTIDGSVITITPPTDWTGFDNTNWVIRDGCWNIENEESSMIGLLNITVE